MHTHTSTFNTKASLFFLKGPFREHNKQRGKLAADRSSPTCQALEEAGTGLRPEASSVSLELDIDLTPGVAVVSRCCASKLPNSDLKVPAPYPCHMC